MKNLATCKPTEFIAQTVRIKDAIANWMEVIDIIRIRETKPVYQIIPQDATMEQKADIIKNNQALKEQQVMKNLNMILDNMLAKHPAETLKVLALCCFVEPENVDDHPMEEYLQCIVDMVGNKSVMNFFTLLAQTQTVAKSI